MRVIRNEELIDTEVTMKFNINSPFWQFMSTCTRFALLNLLFVVTLIPIVTIGPARAALYSTVFAYDDHEDINLCHEYVNRFRREFAQALGSSVLFAACGAFAIFAMAFWNSLSGGTSYVVLPILIIASVVVLFTFETYYPLQARYANTFGATLRNALMLPWFSFGYTLALIAIDIAAVAIFVYAPWLRFLFVLLGCAWIAYAKSLIYLKLFGTVERRQASYAE